MSRIEERSSDTRSRLGTVHPLESAASQDSAKRAGITPKSQIPALVILIGSSATDRSLLDNLLSLGTVLLVVSRPEQVRSWLAGELSQSVYQSNLGDEEQIRIDQLIIDPREHRALWQGCQVPLSERELSILKALAEEPRRAWSFRELQEAVWSSTYFGDKTLVQVAIRRLRIKLQAAGITIDVESVRGYGFRLAIH